MEVLEYIVGAVRWDVVCLKELDDVLVEKEYGNGESRSVLV